jgi:hypothetical protein
VSPATGETVLAAAPPVVRVLAAAPLQALPGASASAVVLIGHPIVLRNATGSPHGVDSVRARLGRRGWSLRAADYNSSVSPTSELRYPPSDQQAANGLVRTLTFPIKLESCATCMRLELVIGANAAPAMVRPRRPSKVQHA